MDIKLPQANAYHKEKGHDLERATDFTSYGRGQIIIRDPKTVVLCGGTEKGIDGLVAAY